MKRPVTKLFFIDRMMHLAGGGPEKVEPLTRELPFLMPESQTAGVGKPPISHVSFMQQPVSSPERKNCSKKCWHNHTITC
jgi:hypothetical protein